MCGIIGITGKNITKLSQAEIQAMLATLSCRGPDDKGIEKFPHCILGQTRLSIIDLSGGHQPMKDNSKNISITFNGEIYNYQELKKDLENKGHTFSTHSDTEVILKAYIEYGADCPKYLDGMFAFAIWDEENQTLFAARDRFGKKPFYYACDESNTLYFASEIKALLASGKIKPKISHKAIDHYIALMYIPPDETVYENVFTLKPAHSLIFKNDAVSTQQYWQLEYNPLSISYQDAKQEIMRLFSDAVKKRMIADVEIGSLLSGGIDSTLVTYYAQKFSSHPIKTFSVGYGNFINELPYAKQASEKIGTEHYTLQASGDQTDELIKVIEYFDEPHADSSDFPQHLVSKLARSKVKVALSGDGADELFMGYGWYWKYWNLGMKEKLQNLFGSPYSIFRKNIQVFLPDERKKFFTNTRVVQDIPEPVGNQKFPPLTDINIFDLSVYLPGQLLTKVDRTGMMNSLEVRSPFLDYKLAEFVFNLPLEYKTDKKSGKIILKDILADIMPKEFVYRRKQGFGAPVQAWLSQEKFKKMIYDTLYSQAHIFEMCNKTYIQKLIDSFYTGNEKLYYKIWVLLCLELWMKKSQI